MNRLIRFNFRNRAFTMPSVTTTRISSSNFSRRAMTTLTKMANLRTRWAVRYSTHVIHAFLRRASVTKLTSCIWLPSTGNFKRFSRKISSVKVLKMSSTATKSRGRKRRPKGTFNLASRRALLAEPTHPKATNQKVQNAGMFYSIKFVLGVLE